SEEMKRATRNLQFVTLNTVQNVNAKDILYPDYVVVDKVSLTKLEERIDSKHTQKSKYQNPNIK
ncbi:50S ribosomal protein L4, partial [Candidatus Berkelbacteria bacterium]|nr:50S ribosomal protein L4 [Candidatus Berkelbacteria bacterium]